MVDLRAPGAGIKFQAERLEDCWAEGLPLLHQNVDETGASRSAQFDYETYLSIEASGRLVVYTIRDGGALVGYCSMVINKHPHFGEKWAIQDALFVLEKYRGFTSVKFMKWCDEQLKSLGAKKIVRQVTAKLDYSRTLERMDYYAVETSYMRSL